MSGKAIHRPYRSISDTSLVEAMGRALSLIKEEDGLTDADLGRELGKAGEDSGRAYRTGFATMNAVSFIRGCQSWNGRFADEVFSLIGMKLTPLDCGEPLGRSSATALTRLLLQVSVALEDGNITDAELVAMRRELDEAGRAIDSMRERLGPRDAAGAGR